MLFSLARPLIFLALVLGFVSAVTLRAVAIRLAGRRLGMSGQGEPLVNLRHDVDPFGAVGAAVCGVGWGKIVSVDEVPRWQGRGRGAMLFLAGPLACIVAGELLLLANALIYPSSSSVLDDGSIRSYFGQDMLLAYAIEVLLFGVLALVPIPPLDGFGVLYFAMRRPGSGMQWMRLWFEEKNIGVVILLALSIFPIGGPYLLMFINWIATPFLAPWLR